MSNYRWCHGPKCHTYKTQDRIKGVKGSKVLRTRKIAETHWNRNNAWSHFCSQGCWKDFMHEHWAEFILLYPRTEALETPILDPKRTTNTYTYGMNDQYSYNRTETKIEVDNTRTNDIG